MRRSLIRLTPLAAIAALVLATQGAGQAVGDTGRATEGNGDRHLRVDRDDTYQVARLTGPASLNRTGERWNVHGTDLGHMFRHEGRLVMTFGDTFGAPGQPPEFGGDWRSSVMASSRDADPSDGITFDRMVTDRPGHAKELIPDAAVPGEEVTVIPTHGTSDGDRMYLHYMAVREWGAAGHWTLNRSGLAYSDDDGQTWTVSDVSWPGDSNFGQVAFVERGRHVYLFGIPGGRFGGAALARVPREHLLDQERYEYWDGARWQGDPQAAATVVDAPVGELSVQGNSHYGTWLMTYLNDDDSVNAVVLRTSDCLTGPWSAEQEVVTAEEVPQLYAPYMPPRWNDGPDVWFSLSRFNHYDVFWWHTSLRSVSTSDSGVPASNAASSGAPEKCVSP
jgi:hypothetical protein